MSRELTPEIYSHKVEKFDLGKRLYLTYYELGGNRKARTNSYAPVKASWEEILSVFLQERNFWLGSFRVEK